MRSCTRGRLFRPGGVRPPTEILIAFIDEHPDAHGAEPICKVLPISRSTYYEHKARENDPDRRPERAKRDESLQGDITRVWEENFRVYGAPKVWRQLNREHIKVWEICRPEFIGRNWKILT